MGSHRQHIAFYLCFASAASILFSISLSQILLALSLAGLFISGEKLRFPPIRLQLMLFAGYTAAAVLLSGDPHCGIPQLRKLFVFAILLVVCSTFKNIRQVRALVLVWATIASVSAIRGIFQFLQRRHEALAQNANDYGFYVDGRITGFSSHWMTFGGEEMIVLLMIASLLLFSYSKKWKLCLWPVAMLLWTAITLGMTRSIFLLALPLGMAYLLWRRKPWLLISIPLAAGLAIIAAPTSVGERAASVIKPHGEVDSNAHRRVTRIVGWEMVKAHPWFGVGPEQVGRNFQKYTPPWLRRPLPNGWYGHLHNIYLQYAAERGLPALFLMLWLIGKVLLDFRRNLSQVTSESRWILHGAIAVIIAILAEGLFEYNLGDSEVLTMFLAVVGCGYGAIKSQYFFPETPPDRIVVYTGAKDVSPAQAR